MSESKNRKLATKIVFLARTTQLHPPNAEDMLTDLLDKEYPAMRVIDGFDEFWQAYPKKVAKGDAEKAWKKLKTDLLPRILEALDQQKQSLAWRKDKGQFIPYPATWLNAKQWEDEISTQVQPAKSSGTFYKTILEDIALAIEMGGNNWKHYRLQLSEALQDAPKSEINKFLLHRIGEQSLSKLTGKQ